MRAIYPKGVNNRPVADIHKRRPVRLAATRHDPGTEGYAEHAAELVKRFEAVSFADKHAAVMHLLPSAPSTVLDVGAGTGAYAAWFASKGHRVVAVEPTDSLRLAGIELHGAHSFEWVDDSLPDLARLPGRDESFDVVMLTAVWMHLDELGRRRAMRRLAALLAPGGCPSDVHPAWPRPKRTAHL